MKSAHATINQVLITLFNDILRIEECTLDTPGLSIREIHVIEAVCVCEDPRITTLAQSLHVTTGSMSVATSTLERKGYLLREKAKEDRRVTYIRPTEKALQIHKKHTGFHREMVDAVMELLNPTEVAILIKALDCIDSYFSEKESEQ